MLKLIKLFLGEALDNVSVLCLKACLYIACLYTKINYINNIVIMKILYVWTVKIYRLP
jgi:hypothetical protein